MVLLIVLVLLMVLPSYFDEIDETMVFKSSSMTKGAGGPSRLDAEQYRHLLTSKKCKKENKELRVQLATLSRQLATKYLDPNTLEAFVACRLIPLDKNPGVRPISTGEVTRRIVAKCISWGLRKDIQQAAGLLQTPTGLQGGAETAIHPMKLIFEQDSTDGVILVDASNAFNSLNKRCTHYTTSESYAPNFRQCLLIHTDFLCACLSRVEERYFL